jgi:hypothetical protein
MMTMLRVVLALTLAVLTAPAFSDGYPQPVEGGSIQFDVYRQGDTEFGTHQVTFERQNDALIARTSIRLRAGVGPITVFRYEHDATESWRDGQLLTLNSQTLKDGNTYQVDAEYENGALQVNGMQPDESPVQLQLPPEILSSSHWHGYPTGMESMLNTEHGTVMETVLENLGQTEIEGDGGMITVQHYRLASEISVDLYYDLNGRWAGCTFEARGQRVHYVRRADPVAG